MPRRVIKLLGQGATAKVELAESTTTGKLYVIKSIKMTAKNLASLKEERVVLKRIRSVCNPYLVCYVKSDIVGNYRQFIFEYLPDFYEMGEIIRKRNEFTPYMQYVIGERLLLGLLQLHSLGIAHRDIKPENIMLNPESLAPVYIDFGFSCTKENRKCLQHSTGTLNYVAPEILKFGNKTFEKVKSSDVFSLGVTILYFCTGIRLWGRFRDTKKLLDTIRDGYQSDVNVRLNDIEQKTNSFCIDLVRGMLRVDWRDRLTAKQALTTWYQGADILLKKRGEELGEKLEAITDIARDEAYGYKVKKGTKIMSVNDPSENIGTIKEESTEIGQHELERVIRNELNKSNILIIADLVASNVPDKYRQAAKASFNGKFEFDFDTWEKFIFLWAQRVEQPNSVVRRIKKGFNGEKTRFPENMTVPEFLTYLNIPETKMQPTMQGLSGIGSLYHDLKTNRTIRIRVLENNRLLFVALQQEGSDNFSLALTKEYYFIEGKWYNLKKERKRVIQEYPDTSIEEFSARLPFPLPDYNSLTMDQVRNIGRFYEQSANSYSEEMMTGRYKGKTIAYFLDKDWITGLTSDLKFISEDYAYEVLDEDY